MRFSLTAASRWRALLPVFVAAALSVSCATTVRPPAAPADPQTVLLLTHGRSSSLLLRDGEGDSTRWAYGDWRYYALGRKRVGDALAALLWPTPAALGRQQIDAEPEVREELLSSLRIGIDEIFTITVDRDAVARLEQRLQVLFAANLETLLYNPGPRLEFVRHPDAYSIFSNSNGRVAAWLRELGCEVSGVPLLSKWRVEPPTRDRGP